MKKQHIPCNGYTPYGQHGDDDQQGDEHFETINSHLDDQKDKFRYINFGNNSFIIFDHAHALDEGLVEKVPHRDADKNKYCEVWFPGFKYITEHEYVNQHETEGVQYPPQPVQIRIGDLGFQLRPGRIYGVLPVLVHVIYESL